MTRVLGLLVDLDGVVRLWRDAGSHAAETTFDLPAGTIAALAYDTRFDLAHHGLLTHEEWVAGVRERLTDKHGPTAAAAIELWAADRGEIDHRVVDLVRRVRASGLRVATLTNNTSILDQDLAGHALTDLFDEVINSAEIGLCKPAPAAFRIAAARLGLPLAAIAFTDDDPTNVIAAVALGMPAHHYTDPTSLLAWLSEHGVDPADPTTATPGTAAPAHRTGSIIDVVLAPLGSSAAPPAAAAEADIHAATHRIRYLATTLTPTEIAAYLGELPQVRAAVPDGSSVAVILEHGLSCEIRAIPPTADPCLPTGHPAAWIPSGTAVSADVEYLPAWTTASRSHARPHLQRLAAHAGWQLTQLAEAHRRGDRLAAAATVDRARVAVLTIAAMLARHHPSPAVGAAVGRYLRPGATARLSTSWRADPTTPDGLARAADALVAELRRIRYIARHILAVELHWPWHDLTRRLCPLLGPAADLTPCPPHDDALYTDELAASYDRHRPIPPTMATGLGQIAQTWLAGADVLELGAGTGRVTGHLAAGTRSYRAVEYAPAMARRLALRTVPGVTVHLGDAHHLDLDDNTLDVVVEHEALPFLDDPAAALEEIQRVLRPGGLLLRILVHPVDPDPAARIDDAYRQAAFADAPGPLIIGKGTDPRLTTLLAARGWTTHEHTVATWCHTRSIDELFASYDAKAWPYQHQATPQQHATGMAAARYAARTVAPDDTLAGTYRLYTFVTTIGAPS